MVCNLRYKCIVYNCIILVALFRRNKQIESWILRIVTKLKLPTITVIIIYVIFGAILVLVEEVMVALETFKTVRKIQKMENILRGLNDEGELNNYEDLSDDEQEALKNFYVSVSNKYRYRMVVMASRVFHFLIWSSFNVIFYISSAEYPSGKRKLGTISISKCSFTVSIYL